MLISEKPLKVIEVREGKALARMERFSVCADCKSMIFPLQTQIFEIEINDKVCIEEGDFVRVGIPGEKLIFYSFALYIFPLAGLIGGTITGHIIRQMFVFFFKESPFRIFNGIYRLTFSLSYY